MALLVALALLLEALALRALGIATSLRSFVHAPPRVRTANPTSRRRETGRETYKRVHWGEGGGRASFASRVPIVAPGGELVELGKLVSVVYVTKKGGDRVLTEYEHDFDAPLPVLAFNASGLFIAGGRYRVTTRGIEG